MTVSPTCRLSLLISNATTMRQPRYLRLWASVTGLLGVLVVLACSCQIDSFASQRLRNRRLRGEGEFSLPTLSPTRTPIRVSLASRGSFFNDEDDNPSNDPDLYPSVSRIDSNINVDYDGGDGSTTTTTRRSDNGARRLGIIAVTLAAVFAAIMLTATAFVWRKYLCNAVFGRKSGQNNDVEITDNLGKQTATKATKGMDSSIMQGASASILRSSDPSLPAKYNPGRRVRFHLPGSPSSVDLAAVASAEYDEDSRVDQEGPIDEPTTKMVKISVHDDSNTASLGITMNRRGVAGPSQSNNLLSDENRVITGTTTPVRNDPETWVTRIMHPWLDSPLCCPEYWEKPGTNSLPSDAVDGSLFDHPTIATNSFESSASSKLNDASSVTPILPSFPTSSKIGGEDEVPNDEPSGSVLGIQGRGQQDTGTGEAFVVEEVGQWKRSREPKPPRCDYGREDGKCIDETVRKETVVVNPLSPSLWRRKSWKRKRGDANNGDGIGDEFDLESASEYGADHDGGRRPAGRLVEI